LERLAKRILTRCSAPSVCSLVCDSGRLRRIGVRLRQPNDSDWVDPYAPWIRPDDDRSLPCPFPRSPDEARPRTRRFGGDPADGPARSPRRDFDRRRRRDLKASGQGRDGREKPAGACLRSCLSRGLGALASTGTPCPGRRPRRWR
jgi:hypothetical protein